MACINFVETALAILRAENISAVEAVNQCFAPVNVVVLEQKMSGHTYAEQGEPEAAADFHVNQCQCDWNAQPAIEHIIKKRIAGIVIIVAIASKTRFLEQSVVERGNGLGGVAHIGNSARRPAG